jgi:hypothetical protein
MGIEKEILYYVENINLDIQIKKYTSLGLYKKDFEKISEDMINNKYYIPGIGYTDNLFSEEYNRSTLRLTHGFTILHPLVYSYKKTKDKKYLLKGIEIVEDWMKKFQYNKFSKSMAFHDETTSLRLIHFIYLFDVCKNVLEIDIIKNLYQEIKNTAQLLTEEDFYSKNTNHGFFQDISLILYSRYFAENEESTNYHELSKDRIKSYFEYIFTESGVHKEHSAAYHFLISNKILLLMKNELIDDNELYEYIKTVHLKTCKFSKYIIKPNGELPCIGDTEPNINVRNIYKNLYEDKNYQYIINREYSNIDLDIDYVFDDAGYAIFRNKWADDAVYVLFSAGYHTYYHKHCDDLSFIVHHNGDIISEAGPFGYMYEDDMCKYGYSSFAHNTLIVNGLSLPRVDGKYDKVKISEYELGENKSTVKGINQRYEGVNHERSLSFDKDNLVISVEDYITSENINDYTLLFHLAPNLVPKQYENIINIYANEKIVCKMEFVSELDLDINCGYGKFSDKIQGIFFSKMYTIDFNYVVYVSIKEAKCASLQTSLKIY